MHRFTMEAPSKPRMVHSRFVEGVFIWLICSASSAALAAEKTAGLLGLWSCQGDDGKVALEFRTQNELIYGGETSRYMLRPDVIVVPGDFVPEEYRYTLKGNHLNLIFPAGQRVECRRTAASAMEAPTSAGGSNPAQLSGRLCKYSGSSSSYSGSSYSSLSTAEFDGRGHLVYGSESSFSGQAGSGYGSRGGTRGTYRINGDNVLIQLEDGSATTAQVNFRLNDGRITELMVGGKLWAAGLCE